MNRKIKSFLEITIASIFVLWLLVYIFFYDKSAYRVDNVSEPFILFLYMESMLLGTLFRKNRDRVGNFKASKVVITIVCLLVYFATKILFSKFPVLYDYQIINQFVILITIFFIFDLFMSMEPFFCKMPKKLDGVVRHISNITLQIYVVQFVIINHCAKISFPLNFITVTLAILAAATLLYYVEFFARKSIVFISEKVKKVKINAKGSD